MNKLRLDDADLQKLAGLILAGGKSPHTGADGLMQAAEMLAKIQAQVNAASKKLKVTP